MTPEQRFADLTARLTRPHAMDTAHYVGALEPVDGRHAWTLFCAAAAGDIDRVQAMVQLEPELVNAQHWYQFPIHMAVREGHAQVVQLLLDAGSDPGLSYYTYNSWEHLLQTARLRGHDAVGNLLQTAMSNRFGYNPDVLPLRDAMRNLDTGGALAVLSEHPELIRASDASGSTPLHWAVLTCQFELIDRLVGMGADVGARRADGQTPAFCALHGDYWYNHWLRRNDRQPKRPDHPFAVLKHLLEQGAAYELSHACAMGDLEHAKSILQSDPAQASRRNSCHRSPLSYAARAGHTDIVRLLLQHGADPCLPETLSPRGQALFAAAAGNHVDTASVLLEAGADANAGEDSSGTCLSIVEHVHGDEGAAMAQLLREHGATTPPWDMDPEEMKRSLRRSTEEVLKTPQLLHELLGHGDAEVLELFLELHSAAVADLVPTEIWGGNLPDVKAIRRLLDAGLEPNRANWIGRTFLHVAAEKGRIDVAKALLNAGAELEAVELEHGSTPLGCAVRGKQADMVSFLRRAGADPEAPEQSPWARARSLAAGNQDLLDRLS